MSTQSEYYREMANDSDIECERLREHLGQAKAELADAIAERDNALSKCQLLDDALRNMARQVGKAQNALTVGILDTGRVL